MDINEIIDKIKDILSDSEKIVEFARDNQVLSYFILGLGAVIENIFPPAPGDTVTVFGGFLVGREALDFAWVLVATSTGSMIGFMGLFYFGYHYGRDFLIKKNWKIFPISLINKTNEWFAKYGYMVIVGNRFLAGIRAGVSVSAGIAKMNPKKVFLFALGSTLLWNVGLLYLGYLAGDNWSVISDGVKKYSQIVFAIIVLVAVFLIIRWWWRKKKTA